MGIHESQSRLWENLIGRSRGFSRFSFPVIQKTFPQALGDVDAETYYRALNGVEPSLIRVEADEVTYNLHIFVRFELEQALMSGDLPVKDLPEAWNSKYQAYLGVRPPNDAEGVLQDVHWSAGSIGYFPSYALGNLYSVPFLNGARAAIPDLDRQIEQGRFEPLLGWLRETIYRHGSKYLPQELIKRVTGAAPESRSYIKYLTDKYGEIYGL
jgi:carboxypeptidase Taq